MARKPPRTTILPRPFIVTMSSLLLLQLSLLLLPAYCKTTLAEVAPVSANQDENPVVDPAASPLDGSNPSETSGVGADIAPSNEESIQHTKFIDSDFSQGGSLAHADEIPQREVEGGPADNGRSENKRFIAGLYRFSRPHSMSMDLYPAAEADKRFMRGFSASGKRSLSGYPSSVDGNVNSILYEDALVDPAFGNYLDNDKRFIHGLAQQRSVSEPAADDKRFINGLTGKRFLKGFTGKRFMKGFTGKRFMKGFTGKRSSDGGLMDNTPMMYTFSPDLDFYAPDGGNENGLEKKSQEKVDGSANNNKDFDDESLSLYDPYFEGEGAFEGSDDVDAKRFMKGLTGKRFIKGFNTGKRFMRGFATSKRFMKAFTPGKRFMRDFTDKRFMKGFTPGKRFMRGFTPDKRFMRGLTPGKRFMRGFSTGKRFMKGLTGKREETESPELSKKFMKGFQGKRFIKGFNSGKRDGNDAESPEMSKKFMKGFAKKEDDIQSLRQALEQSAQDEDTDDKRFLKGMVKRSVETTAANKNAEESRMRNKRAADGFEGDVGFFPKLPAFRASSWDAGIDSASDLSPLSPYDSFRYPDKRFIRGSFGKRDLFFDDPFAVDDIYNYQSDDFVDDDDVDDDDGDIQIPGLSKRFIRGFQTKRFLRGWNNKRFIKGFPTKRFIRGFNPKRFMIGLNRRQNSLPSLPEPEDSGSYSKRFMRGLSRPEKRFIKGLAGYGQKRFIIGLTKHSSGQRFKPYRYRYGGSRADQGIGRVPY